MSVFSSILFACLIFSFLIFIHELGHFIAAKLSGVRVNEFAMFMGPAIAKWHWGETLYSIRTIPVGGYCAMEGEDDSSDDPRSFGRARWWKRLIILVAGSAMNFMAGVVMIAVVLSLSPNYATTQVIELEPASSMVEQGGLQVGDTIQSIDGRAVRIYSDFVLETMLMADGQYDVVVTRNGETVELDNVLWERREFEEGAKRFGLSFGIAETTLSSVPGRIWPTAMNYVRSVVVSLEMLLTGKASVVDMTGPVGIVQIMTDTAQQSEDMMMAMVSMLDIGAMIAINLAMMNMLPIPALDGGRTVGLLLTTGIEKITRKKLDPKIESYVHGVGMIILLAFMAFIMFKDVFMLIKG